MLGIIVVPRHAVVVKECEQFVLVLFNSLLERQSDLGPAFHIDDVLDEFCSGSPGVCANRQSHPADCSENHMSREQFAQITAQARHGRFSVHD
jgi:hypothetical protein